MSRSISNEGFYPPISGDIMDDSTDPQMYCLTWKTHSTVSGKKFYQHYQVLNKIPSPTYSHKLHETGLHFRITCTRIVKSLVGITSCLAIEWFSPLPRLSLKESSNRISKPKDPWSSSRTSTPSCSNTPLNTCTLAKSWFQVDYFNGSFNSPPSFASSKNGFVFLF